VNKAEAERETRTREDFARNVWDEFDEFFSFQNNKDAGPSARDDTKGADYKAEVEINFMDAVKGVKTVSYP
jgi:DnaJ-class molecular chaperone